MTAIKRTDGLVTINRIFIVRNGRILILKRSTENKSYVGLWELPGGTVESNRQGFIEAEALRELKEETGYERHLELLRMLAFDKGNHILPDGALNRMKFMTYYWYVEIDSEPVRRSEEHSAIDWRTLSQLEGMSDELTPRTVSALSFLHDDLGQRLSATT